MILWSINGLFFLSKCNSDLKPILFGKILVIKKCKGTFKFDIDLSNYYILLLLWCSEINILK